MGRMVAACGALSKPSTWPRWAASCLYLVGWLAPPSPFPFFHWSLSVPGAGRSALAELSYLTSYCFQSHPEAGITQLLTARLFRLTSNQQRKCGLLNLYKRKIIQLYPKRPIMGPAWHYICSKDFFAGLLLVELIIREDIAYDLYNIYYLTDDFYLSLRLSSNLIR